MAGTDAVIEILSYFIFQFFIIAPVKSAPPPHLISLERRWPLLGERRHRSRPPDTNWKSRLLSVITLSTGIVLGLE